jgi:hypothetical protein
MLYLHNECSHHQRILHLSQLDIHKLFHGKYPTYTSNKYYKHNLNRTKVLDKPELRERERERDRESTLEEVVPCMQ